jgi:hypothetical protein
MVARPSVTDLDALLERVKAEHGEVGYTGGDCDCRECRCGEPWPCDTIQLVEALEAERANHVIDRDIAKECESHRGVIADLENALAAERTRERGDEEAVK